YQVLYNPDKMPRRGVTLESLQILANRMMFKDDEEFPRVKLDIDGYSSGHREKSESRDEAAGDEQPAEGGEEKKERRRERPDRRRRRGEHFGEGNGGIPEEQLAQMARDAAKEVKRWGTPKSLPEMNARDRRIIHITLQDDPEIQTESHGDGAMKKVMISLKKEE
ncbi:MAG: hypothetical protein MJ025_06770, partial [Victivallaceae bacterium]|nr:hypothetical protein [Victivallaceae bacterium]